MTEIPTYQHFVVDAFTSIPYEGNPAAVIIIHGKEWPDEGKNRAQGHEWMVRVAREFNLSETAFILLPSEQADDKIVKCGLRWRTPTVEVNLCGHATLASSYVLAYELGLATSSTTTIEFQTKFSGILTAQATVVHDGNDKGNGIQMSLPAISVISPQSEADRKSLQSRWFEALGLDGKLPLESLEYIGTTGLDDSFLIVPSSEVLCALTPHYEKVASFGGRGVIVTCISKLQGVSFESRFFAPSMGQTEDPVRCSCDFVLFVYISFMYIYLYTKLNTDDKCITYNDIHM